MQAIRLQKFQRRRKGASRSSWIVRKGDFLVAASYLTVISLFGGGQVTWTPANMVLVVATVALAMGFVWRDGGTAFWGAPPAGRLALAGIAALPLLQLVPLPPALWHALPGQELRRATLTLVDLADSWQPLTLQPASTAPIALMAVGFVAFAGWLLRLPGDDFRRLFLVALGLVLLNIVIGLMQVVSIGQFPRIHTDNMGATLYGLFANKNHMALVLACSILMFELVFSRQVRSKAHSVAAEGRRRVMVAGYTAFALVAIVATNSRAGLGLGGVATIIVLLDLARGVALRWRIAGATFVAILIAAVVSSSAFEIVAGRVDDVGNDLRWRFLGWSWPLAEQYGWLGSGFGSFSTLFITHEKLEWLKPTFVNAVHNDYLQLLIEGGVPAMVLLTLLLLSLIPGIAALRRLSRRAPERHALAAGIAISALFALHTLVDYPLRRPGAWIIFTLAVTAIYRGIAASKGGAGESLPFEAA